MPTEDAYSSGHLVLSHWDLQMFSCWDHWHSITRYTSLWHLSLIWLFTDFDIISVYRFPKGICNGCGMPTGDAYSSGHLVLSHFGTCKCSNVETNISWTCLVSGLLSFEHPSVLLFLLPSSTVDLSWLIRSVMRALISIFRVEIYWNCNFWGLFTIPFGFSLFWHFSTYLATLFG